MRGVLTLEDARLTGHRVLFRVDINSPLDPATGQFLDDSRLRAILPTLRRLADARVVMLGHQSRPGRDDFTSMEGHADRISRLLGRPIRFVPDVCGEVALEEIRNMRQGEMLMLDNVRGLSEENDMNSTTTSELAESSIVTGLSSVCDAYVTDAFAAAHRNSPSLSGFGRSLPCFAGVLMAREVEALGIATDSPPQPYVVILGGVKCDDSLRIARHLIDSAGVSSIITVGVVGNLMLWASGLDIGETNRGFIERTLGDAFESTFADATELWSEHSDVIILPRDLAVEIDDRRVAISVEALPTEHPIYDIGIRTLMEIRPTIMEAGCILWNGPASYFEKQEFAFGTIEILNLCMESDGYTIVGGGHTSAIVNQRRGAIARIGHNSTGGGACLTILSGGEMPAISSLKESADLFANRLSELGMAL